MNFLIFVTIIHIAFGGVINEDHEVQHHERATSYQNIHIEHFHPVPTYIKKEYKHLLEHPVSLGTSSSKVEVHHGGKHDHGYGFATAENNLHGGHGYEDLALLGGHESAATNSYQVQDHQGEIEQYQQQDHDGQALLGHYQLGEELQGYANLDAGHVQHE